MHEYGLARRHVIWFTPCIDNHNDRTVAYRTLLGDFFECFCFGLEQGCDLNCQ